MKLYTPLQILIATFLGGPFTATYLLSENFKTRKQKKNFQKTIIVGAIISVLFILTFPFLPAVIPTSAYAFLYLAVASIVVKMTQMTGAQIQISKKFEAKTIGNTIVAALIGFLVYIAMYIIISAILAQLGIVRGA